MDRHAATASEAEVFPLARMCGLLRALTLGVLLLPVLFLGAGWVAPGPVGLLLVGVGLLVALLYASIWLLWRPTRFEVTPSELRLVWPLRRRSIPRTDVRDVRCIDRAAFRTEFGWCGRIGAGGLWGGFGWLWTSRHGLLDLYVSRLDRWVLVERRSARDLLLTPRDPDAFVRCLGRGA